MTATFKAMSPLALLVVLSAPSAHAVNVRPALQPDTSRAEFPLSPVLPGQIPAEVLADEGKALLQFGYTEEEIQEADASNETDPCSFCVNAGTNEPDGCHYDSLYGACMNEDSTYYCHQGGTFSGAVTSCEAPTVSGTGDPHLRNLRGEQFDIYQPGIVALLRLPRLAEPARTLLLVEADVRRMGSACSIYFQVVAISGTWTNESKPIQFLANPHGAPEGRNWKEWMRFGPIELKVAHRTKGVDYLNVYARNIGKSGYEVGGLLGLDDHAAVATRPRECAHRHAAALWSSVAAAL